MALGKLCPRHGVQPAGYCPQCAREDSARKRDKPKYKNIWGTPRWRQVREYVLNRDDYRCVTCGKGAPEVVLTVDHLHYDAPFDPATCVTRCNVCHGRKDGGKR